nr:MAG TPA: hydrogenase/urease nickel incorporation protein [Caudoviricetes sp.]
MEIKEALGIIEERISFTIGIIDGVIIDGVIGEAMNTIKNAVEKQSPKKVILNKEYPLYKLCPNCGKNLFSFANGWEYTYCHYCGQRLDWIGIEKIDNKELKK